MIPIKIKYHQTTVNLQYPLFMKKNHYKKKKVKTLHHQYYHTLMKLQGENSINPLKAPPPPPHLLIIVQTHPQQETPFRLMGSHLMTQMEIPVITT